MELFIEVQRKKTVTMPNQPKKKCYYIYMRGKAKNVTLACGNYFGENLQEVLIEFIKKEV